MQKNKQKLLRILDIIKETDESHPITANRIAKQLSLYGIDAERKSILRDINALTEYGYDIVLHHDNKLGFYLASRDFEDWELKLLADAVLSARFLTKTETEKLVRKIYLLSSIAGQKKLRSLTPVVWDKSENRTVKINIDKIISAIHEQKKIAFKYEFTDITLVKKPKRNGHIYTVSPFALYRRDDRYYIIANTDGYDNLSCYRLDRMRNLTISDRSARSAESIVGGNADLKIANYIRDTLYNFSGEKIILTLDIKANAVDDLIDFFEHNLKIRADGERIIATIKTTKSEGLYRWLLQFSGNVTAISPQCVKSEMQKRIQLAAKSYNCTSSTT